MEKKFNPYDRVLVRDGYGVWGCDLYSHWDENEKSHRTVGFGSGIDISDEEILSFEKYSYLLGTTDEPDEEVRLEEGEWILPADIIGVYEKVENCIIRQFDYAADELFKCKNSTFWALAIRFKDFDPFNMEETLKHILCVKDGKVVKYRENNK